MGRAVTDDELFERARAVAQHQLSEQEAREDLTEEETVRFLRYLSDFKSIGWAVKAYRLNQLNQKLLKALGNVLPSDAKAKAELHLATQRLAIKHDFTDEIAKLTSENRARIELARKGRYSKENDSTYWTEKRYAQLADKLLSAISGTETRSMEFKVDLEALGLETLSKTTNTVRAYKIATVLSFIQDIINSINN